MGREQSLRVDRNWVKAAAWCWPWGLRWVLVKVGGSHRGLAGAVRPRSNTLPHAPSAINRKKMMWMKSLQEITHRKPSIWTVVNLQGYGFQILSLTSFSQWQSQPLFTWVREWKSCLRHLNTHLWPLGCMVWKVSCHLPRKVQRG